MGRDNNAIFGYGFLFNNSLIHNYINSNDSEVDIELFEDIRNYCTENSIDICYDRYWTDYEIFIGIIKHKVQNGNNTYSRESGWFSQKDQLTKENNIEFRINIEVKDKIENAYHYIKQYDKKDKYILGEPRWLLFTFNT